MPKKDYQTWSKDKLIQEIENLLKRKKFGIVWEDKPEQVAEQCKEFLPVLKEETKLSIKDKKSDKTHILIEGDNYHALSVLNYTHKKKVDVIYIDPPYNTGNKDFKYNDRYVDKEDSYRHSKWLSFMSKRLKLAKNLLKDDGVFFVSIDDNELCDEVFNERNFVAAIVWQKVYSPKNQSKRISNDHEYIFAYAKNIDLLDFDLLPRTEGMNARYKNPTNDPRGPWKPGDLVANEERKNGHFIITGPHGDKFDSPPGKHWAFSQERMTQMLKEDRLFFGKTGKSFPAFKQFLNEVQQGRKPSTVFLHNEAGHNDEAKKELKQFFPQSEELFSTPKPTRLMKQLLRLSKNKNALVLDFMAGSGTTGHAVLDLNNEDGGQRQFILCTNNEVNGLQEKLEKQGSKQNQIEKYGICRSITYPRLKKLFEGFVDSEKKKIPGYGGNLKYYLTPFVDKVKTDNDKRVLVSRSTEMLCLAENTFSPVIAKKGEYAIFENSVQQTGIIYDEDSIDDFNKTIKKFNKPTVVYVFSYDHTFHEEDFDDIKQLIKVKAIPEVILNVYKKIHKELYKIKAQ
jgi:adenine-specific DNA-methyltransferase